MVKSVSSTNLSIIFVDLKNPCISQLFDRNVYDLSIVSTVTNVFSFSFKIIFIFLFYLIVYIIKTLLPLKIKSSRKSYSFYDLDIQLPALTSNLLWSLQHVSSILKTNNIDLISSLSTKCFIE